MAVSSPPLTGALIVAPPPSDPNLPLIVHRDAAGRCAADLHPRDLAQIVQQKNGLLWVDIDSSSRHQHALLEKVFGFHHLAIEDTLNPQSRVKIEEFEGYLFVIVRAVTLFTETEDDPYDLETKDLYFFLGPNYLVTVHDGVAPAVQGVAQRLLRTPDPLSRGVARVMHAIMDDAVDQYFPMLDTIDEFIDDLEERVFTDFDDSALRDIFQVKRLVLSLRRYLAPQREVFNLLTNRPSALLTTETQLYFRDIYDHVLRINESLETYRDLLSSTLDSYLSQVSNRLGTATKALSALATISLPFVIVSGMWGMNFATVPLANWAHGFWVMLAAQLLLGFMLLALLRWRKIL
ncbi:MAG: magnesium/cobalt transporter CorA [Gemmatimonadaceae bacterium]|jgi:magnesium transporter|nr:magnesium/cobalt transporter CorA [Gemmatimonadaceae bacterium]